MDIESDLGAAKKPCRTGRFKSGPRKGRCKPKGASGSCPNGRVKSGPRKGRCRKASARGSKKCGSLLRKQNISAHAATGMTRAAARKEARRDYKLCREGSR